MKFYINLFVSSAIIFFMVNLASWAGYLFLHPFFFQILLFMYVLSSVSYLLVGLTAKYKSDSVMNAFMVTILLKLLFSGLFVFWYLYNFSENEISFVVTFFCIYIFFTVFEIFSLLSVLNSTTNDNKETN